MFDRLGLLDELLPSRRPGLLRQRLALALRIASSTGAGRLVKLVPLEDFAPLQDLGVPLAAELQPEDPILTARRALAMDGQALSLLGSNTAEFISLCLHGHKETHHIDKLKVTLSRVAVGAMVAGFVHDVSAAIGAKVRRRRR